MITLEVDSAEIEKGEPSIFSWKAITTLSKNALFADVAIVTVDVVVAAGNITVLVSKALSILAV